MAKNKTQKRSLKTDIHMIWRGYKLLYQACPQYLLWQTVSAVSSMLLPYFALYMSSTIINAVFSGKDAAHLMLLAAVTVAGTIVIQILHRAINCKVEEQDNSHWYHMEMLFLRAQSRMQFKHFDDPETAQLRQRIRDFSNYGGHGLARLSWDYRDMMRALFDMIVSVTLTVSLFRTVSDASLNGFLAFVNSPWSLLMIVAFIVLTILVNSFSVRYFQPKQTKVWEERGQERALFHRYVRDGAPDGKVMNGDSLVLLRGRSFLFDTVFAKKLYKTRAADRVILDATTTLLNIVLGIYVAAKAFIGTFGIGNFVLYQGTIQRFTTAFISFAASFVNLRHNNKYMEEVFRFFELPDEMYRGTLAVEKRDDNQFEIEFRNVSFKYPGCDTYALRNVSFKFRIGEKLAFVGMNGSGKTTFIKLLCRLYDPTEGQILLNGIDITRYKLDEYLALFSVVFQDFYLFHYSLAENVACSLDYDEERITEVLERVGYGDRLRELEKGLNTCCGKHYDVEGLETSTGEAQKIALARALYKNAPFFILDEPTASLDPIAEADVYARFNEIVTDKTAVFISHRLSSCRFCDHIVVFHEGQLIQYGSHNELIADENGQYYALWTAQAQHYTE